MSAPSAQAYPPPAILLADAPDALSAFLLARASEALAKSRGLEAAESVKRALEAAYPGLWHVVVGGPFGASVAHENGGLVLARVDGVEVLAFQVSRERRGGVAPASRPGLHTIPRAARPQTPVSRRGGAAARHPDGARSRGRAQRRAAAGGGGGGVSRR